MVAVPRITSDHSPILLSTCEKVIYRRFRFEEVWLTRGDFCSLVPIWWGEVPTKSSSALTFAAKLRHCRKRMKEWRATSFYTIARTMKAFSDEIQQLDTLEESQNLTLQQLDRRRQLKSHILKVVAEEEILWKARAKQHWLREGDDNTKFFHAMANGKRRENAINAVGDNGRLLYREGDKREYFFTKFKEVFAPISPNSTQVGDWSGLFGSRTLLNPDRLSAPFTLEEVRKATFDLGSDKAPGPDGFNLRFSRNSGR